MTLSTVIEILASIFIVYGLYFMIKMLAFRLLYPKDIRNALEISIRIYDSDTMDTIKIKQMCASRIARDYMIAETLHINKIDKEEKWQSTYTDRK